MYILMYTDTSHTDVYKYVSSSIMSTVKSNYFLMNKSLNE